MRHPRSDQSTVSGVPTLDALALVLVNPSGRVIRGLDGLPLRRVTLAQVTASDDIAVLCGPGPGRHTQNLADRLGAATPRVFVIAPSFDHDDAALALTNGATSYVVEGQHLDLLGLSLTEQIEMTAAGMSCLDPRVATVLVEQARGARHPATALTHVNRHDPDSAIALLTARENQIMRLFAGGQSTAEVAAGLFISQGTLRNYLVGIYTKLGVRRRQEAILAWLGYRRPKGITSVDRSGTPLRNPRVRDE